MIIQENPKLQTLVGKTISKVIHHTSCGDIIDVSFTDGTLIQVCVSESIYHKDELQLFMDGNEL